MTLGQNFEDIQLSNTNSNSFIFSEKASFKILSSNNQAEWSDYLNKLPKSLQDVYYTPEYYQIYEKNGDGKALCFVFELNNNLALYPFLLNKINDLGYQLEESFYDIQGAYGYNGILSSSNDPEFRKSFYIEFNKFCLDNILLQNSQDSTLF
ncbi:MAG TPA: hypothetical protein PKE38_13970 [Ignavibacteriaceae bacterium]|nr:hypothetical protein [Ignavibacteriaceae bacterium]